MCGRFVADFSMDDLVEHLARELPGWRLDGELRADPDYNVAPTREIAVVVPENATASLSVTPMHWGLVPAWAKDASGAARLINARVESVHERPSYRGLLGGARHHRCVVPMSGFYEWRNEGGKKFPVYARPSEGRIMCAAALWTRSERLEITSVTILTRPAYAAVAPHHDRSPVVLSGASLAEWLGAAGDGLDAARSAPEPSVEVREVGTAVNSTRNNGPELIRPTDPLL